MLAGVDVLVNAASYRVNLDAMKACLEAGSHYIDLGGLYHLTGEQLALHDRFRRRGAAGAARHGILAGQDQRDGRSRRARAGHHARAGGRVGRRARPRPTEAPSYPYAPRTLVDELTLAPMAVRDGEAVELEPLKDGGAFDFPEPIGEAETIYTLHSEVRTFPESFGCTECSFRLSLAPAVLERVRGLIGASDEEIDAAAKAAVPSSPDTVSIHAVEAEAGGDAVRVTAVTRGMEEWSLGGGIVSTAAPAAAAVRLLARGEIEARGALPPERCIDPDALFGELERRNCSFSTEGAAVK